MKDALLLTGRFLLTEPTSTEGSVMDFLSFKLLSHLETYTHTIVIIGDSTDSAEGRTALEGTDGLDEVEQLCLVEEQADAVGSLRSIARHTQEQALHLNGMSLLIKSIIALP